MCCNFGCNRCNCNNGNNIRVIRGPMGPAGPRGPQGPQGATGATGATGASGTNNAVYANSGATTVATQTIIPLALNTSTAGNTFSVTDNHVVLPQSGTYLVSFFVNGYSASGSLVTALYLNDSAITNQAITLSATSDSVNSGSKTVLITATAGSRLSLYNASTDSATLSDASLTVMLTA